MTSPQLTRIRDAIVAGALGGVCAGLVFATAHAFIIVPIWDRMFGSLAGAGLAGAVAGWAFAELFPAPLDFTPSAMAGAKYGALLWLAVVPVTVEDAALRAVGFLPRHESIGVVIAVGLAVIAGAAWGWLRTRRMRSMVATASATLALTMIMGGPVPAGRNVWALGIFLAVLPDCVVAGTILGSAIALARPRTATMAP